VIYDFFYDAKTLFDIARRAYDRTKDVSGDRDPLQKDALVAITFSAATLEAFINEAADLAWRMRPVSLPPRAESLTTFGKLAREVETLQGGVQFKYHLASTVFAGHPYDEGRPPFQDFDDLLTLRNRLLHLRPMGEVEPTLRGRMVVENPPFVERLRGRNITAIAINTETPVPWIDRISTRAAARWACNSAAEMIRSVVTMAPSGDYGDALRIAQFQWFRPVS
jgi:hypothetical protein